uniref:Disintegrin domain-containing protein n=1 Tax=Macrostomum lignano TaxID=282301 RepID=A0A1I8IGZ0_9PLAT
TAARAVCNNRGNCRRQQPSDSSSLAASDWHYGLVDCFDPDCCHQTDCATAATCKGGAIAKQVLLV